MLIPNHGRRMIIVSTVEPGTRSRSVCCNHFLAVSLNAIVRLSLLESCCHHETTKEPLFGTVCNVLFVPIVKRRNHKSKVLEHQTVE